jgi:hypothetical protein
MTTVTTPLAAVARLARPTSHPKAILAIVLVSYFMILLGARAGDRAARRRAAAAERGSTSPSLAAPSRPTVNA